MSKVGGSDSKNTLFCSFCGKSQHEVRILARRAAKGPRKKRTRPEPRQHTVADLARTRDRVAAAERRIDNDRRSNPNRGRAGLERAQLELSVIVSQLRLRVRDLLRVGAGPVLDAAVAPAMRRRPVLEWGFTQAMHVFGVNTPHAALAAAAQYRTRDVSARVTQDVLLCAGEEDHYVPLHQLYDQARWLTGARSVTTRVVTRLDQAQKPLPNRKSGAGVAHHLRMDRFDSGVE